jgi:hypothetical protein
MAIVSPVTAASTDVANYDGPNKLSERMEYAKALAQANLLPDEFRRQPANVLYAIEYGRALNISPIAAFTGIHVIEGKPSASSGLISALVRRAGHRLRVRMTGTVAGGDITAVCEIVRSDDPDFTFAATWDLQRALRSGLIDALNIDEQGRTVLRARTKKGLPSSWEKFPEAMLKARAITEAAREACEEALSGLHYTAEELGAQVDGDEQVIVQGEVVETPAPVVPPQSRQAQPTRDPQEAAAAIALWGFTSGNADKLRGAIDQAQQRGLADIDVHAAIAEKCGAGVMAGVPSPLRLAAWLEACAITVGEVETSVQVLVDTPLPDRHGSDTGLLFSDAALAALGAVEDAFPDQGEQPQQDAAVWPEARTSGQQEDIVDAEVVAS